MNVNKLPTGAWVCITAVILGLFATIAALSITGTDTTEFYRLLNVAANFASVILSGGAFAYAGKASQQTNGGLDIRIQEGAKRALEEHQNS